MRSASIKRRRDVVKSMIADLEAGKPVSQGRLIRVLKFYESLLNLLRLWQGGY
ncbi:hypothetical protein ES705_21017 [subsurface metagenome]